MIISNHDSVAMIDAKSAKLVQADKSSCAHADQLISHMPSSSKQGGLFKPPPPVYLLIPGYASAAVAISCSAALLLLLHTSRCCCCWRPLGFANPPPPQHPPLGSVFMIPCRGSASFPVMSCKADHSGNELLSQSLTPNLLQPCSRMLCFSLQCL